MVDIPNPEQCSAKELVFEDEFMMRFAMWFPQLGGYVGRSLVTILKGNDRDYDGDMNSCFDVQLWHDGEFPYDNREPIDLHFCDSDQLRKMADNIDAMSIKAGNKVYYD